MSSLPWCKTQIGSHTNTYTHTGVMSLSLHLSPLSHELCTSYYLVFVYFPRKLLSLSPFVPSLVTVLTFSDNVAAQGS